MAMKKSLKKALVKQFGSEASEDVQDALEKLSAFLEYSGAKTMKVEILNQKTNEVFELTVTKEKVRDEE